MLTSDFDFALPPAHIAAHPARPRDSARLLQVATTELHDRHVRDLPGLLAPGDVLVFNDTRVVPARLKGQRGAARVELMLHQPLPEGRWRAFARPAKRLRPGDVVTLREGAAVTVVAREEGGEVILDFGTQPVFDLLHRCGEIPLPPYIPRPHGPEACDQADYQTIFAARNGAVAAPTAGLHFTPELLAALTARGVTTAAVTLHVGAGTFLPVKSENVHEHRMHAEYGEISAGTAATIATARATGGRVVAVGTTALRLLESAATAEGGITPFAGETALFILPGYRFRIVDRLLTNFHLPRSTLYMLVSAFAGVARMRTAYAHAIASGYRFYSYGDTSLLDRCD